MKNNLLDYFVWDHFLFQIKMWVYFIFQIIICVLLSQQLKKHFAERFQRKVESTSLFVFTVHKTYLAI